jgi:hypothetical protein
LQARERSLIEGVTYFPDYELVVILATERSQVLLVVGERQTLDQHLMHLESVHHLKRVEVPDDDVRLHARKYR